MFTHFHVGQDLLKFEEGYSRVVSTSATVTLKITKCTTIGPPRIGKTCLKHLLTGQEWDVDGGTASTDVMEAPEWVECYSVEEAGAGELWKLVSKEQRKGQILRAVHTTTSSPLATTSSDAPAKTALVTSDASATTTPNVATATMTSSYDLDVSITAPATDNPSQKAAFRDDALSTDTPSPQKTQTFMQALQALAEVCDPESLQKILDDNEGRVLGETRLIHFIDTGGQAIYHDVHPILITSPSVYLVVFSLKDFSQKNEKERFSYFHSDLIQRPLRSIYTFGTKTPQEKGICLHPKAPRIFIVGTHLDQICLPLGENLEAFLNAVDEMIEKEISTKPYHQFVQYDTEGRSFWAVDNTLAGRKQDDKDKKYITTLRMMIQEKSMEMSVTVPLPWMLLKLVIDSMRMCYCEYSELMEEARIRGYVRQDPPETELDAMLKLFHILGLVYHKVPTGYDKENSLVFSDPDCLFSATSDFLMAAKEEIQAKASSVNQHHSQGATMEENEGGSEVDQHEILPARKKRRRSGEELAEGGVRQLVLEPVARQGVIKRMQDNVEGIAQEVEAVLQTVEGTIEGMGQNPTEEVLTSLHAQLEKEGMKYKLSCEECQDALPQKAKRQLFIGQLVNSLASSVERVLNDFKKRRDVDHMKKEVDKTVRNIRTRCQSRFISSSDVEQFLSILTDLRIIAKLSSTDSYVVPAALPRYDDRAWQILAARGIEPLLFTLISEDGLMCYLPSSLFCCLISELVTELHWTVIPLGRTHIAFIHEDLTGMVHLRECDSYIEVNIIFEEEAALQVTELCIRVREQMHQRIKHVYSMIYDTPESKGALVNSPKSNNVLVGFKCICGHGGAANVPHFAAYQFDEFEHCMRCLLQRPTEYYPLTDEQSVWFPERCN